MEMLRTAIAKIEAYKISEIAEQFLANHPYEGRRRVNYINYIVKTLWQAVQMNDESVVKLLKEDVHETLQYKFYGNYVDDEFSVVLEEVLSLIIKHQSTYSHLNCAPHLINCQFSL